MDLGTPTPDEIRAEIEGYGFDEISTLTKVASYLGGVTSLSGFKTTDIRPYFFISGAGIAPGTRVVGVTTVDPINGTIEIDTPTTGPATDDILTLSYYCVKTDEWLINQRDNFVVPWVEAKTRQSFHGIQETEEYYDGTGSPVMALRKRPIQELISISYTNVDTNLYYLTPTAILTMKAEGILKAKSNFNDSSYIPIFYKGERNIRIKYRYGYTEMPGKVKLAVAKLVAEQALGSAGSKTGGGDTTGEGYSKNFGQNGKYTYERRRLATGAMAILREYITGTGL